MFKTISLLKVRAVMRTAQYTEYAHRGRCGALKCRTRNPSTMLPSIQERMAVNLLVRAAA